MIPRFSRPEMVAIWEPATKFRIWFEIEAHACDALADLGVIPKKAAKAIRKGGNKPYTKARIARIERIEARVKHDVIAFLTELSEQVGDDGRYVHLGLTSSDVLDTCLAKQLTQAADLLGADIDKLLKVLERRARQHKLDICIGRSQRGSLYRMALGIAASSCDARGSSRIVLGDAGLRTPTGNEFESH